MIEPVKVRGKLMAAQIEEDAAKQKTIIAQCDGEILYCQGQLGKFEQQKTVAQELLEDLEYRLGEARSWEQWPTKEKETSEEG